MSPTALIEGDYYSYDNTSQTSKELLINTVYMSLYVRSMESKGLITKHC